jgi:hypothetical protein
MNDDFVCGTPFEQQRMQDEQTLEGMVDGMGLRAVLLILQSRLLTPKPITSKPMGETPI